jgi:hypothetical protein
VFKNRSLSTGDALPNPDFDSAANKFNPVGKCFCSDLVMWVGTY